MSQGLKHTGYKPCEKEQISWLFYSENNVFTGNVGLKLDFSINNCRQRVLCCKWAGDFCLHEIKECSVRNSFLTGDGVTPSLKVIYISGRHAVV